MNRWLDAVPAVRQLREGRERPLPVGPLRLMVVVAAAAAALQGCGDGYPQDDSDQTSPFDMTNAQRLSALNIVAAQALRHERTRFELQASVPGALKSASDARATSHCLLGWHRQRTGAPTITQQHRLDAGMDAVVAHDPASGHFEVHLVEGTGPDARRLAVLLRSASWTHATQADLLVQLMIRDCAAR